MAGIAALLNTKMGAAQGNLNPMLYRLAASTPAAFHDVTIASSGVRDCNTAIPSMCNNSTPGQSSLTGGLAGYEVGVGYDLATGLGSLDVADFIAAVAAGGGGTSGSFTLTATPSAMSVTPVANTTTTSTWALTAKSVGGFAGDVALSCSVSPVTAQPPACGVAPGSFTLAGGGTGTATISLTTAGPSSRCLANSATNRTGGFGVMLAGALLLLMPVRGRRMLRGVGLMVLMGLGLGVIGGCSGSATSIPCSNVATAGTTAGTYTVTVTGTSGSLSVTAPATITVTVN